MPQSGFFVGGADEFITDSVRARETMEKLISEAEAWTNFIIGTGGRLRSALEDLRRFAIGERHPGDPSNVAIIYREAGAGGPSRGLNAGDYLRNFQDIHHPCGRTLSGTTIWCQWNDRVNAINVREGFFMACYFHANFGGDRLVISGPARLHDLPAMGWGDCISSAMVYPIDKIDVIF